MAASVTCARIPQYWPLRIWMVPSLTIFKSGSFSESLSLKTQRTKCNWKRGSLLFRAWKFFLTTTKRFTTQTLSPIWWLLWEISDTTWALKGYSHVWICFLRNVGRDPIRTRKRSRSGIRDARMQSWCHIAVGLRREEEFLLLSIL